ncbi:hypothetical protein ACPEIF_26435 [Streptomyces sp. NPDC012600]|uniref:hypothetical protein n=1 Tax=Streptomyces sp. NPDC012600 TaxID=3415005 RepID=UPI003C2EF03A
MTATQAGDGDKQGREPERGPGTRPEQGQAPGRVPETRPEQGRAPGRVPGRTPGPRWDRGRLKGAWLVLVGTVLFALGAFIVVTGTGLSGVLGMRVETFGRITCHDTRAEKGQTVWHCFGQSPAQQRANDAEKARAAREALRVHVDGMPKRAETGRTRITFADHDGKNDPETITATQVFEGGRWYAHSGTLVGYGMVPLLLGAGTAAWGVYRVREAGGWRGR